MGVGLCMTASLVANVHFIISAVKPLAKVCMYFSVASPKVLTLPEQNLMTHEVAALYWLHFQSERSILTDLSVSNCSYSLAKKDANLRPVHKGHARYSRDNWSAFTRLKFNQKI